MRRVLTYFTAFSALFSIGLISYGLYIQQQQPARADTYLGLGTVGLFLVAMPLFLIKESKGKSLRNYTLTKEKLENMRNKAQKGRKI